MISQAILKWGGDAQSSFWLNRMATGDVIGAFALTEADIGSDAGHIGTTATQDGRDYILNGGKQWISLGQIADLFLIFAQYKDNLCAFLLERNTPGLTVEAINGMLGVRATMLAKLQLTDCRVPKKNLIGGVGFGLVPVAIDALNLGRYSIAWGCVGLAQACLEASIKYTGKRKQFGVYIKDHQLIQQMITDMTVNIKAARLLCCQAGLARERNHPNSLSDTFIAKYFASTMATRVASDAVQIHGALGCSRILPIQRYLRDAKIMEVIEGTTQIHQIEIAKHACQTYTNGQHV
jgi:alkylation response protein AidB-like acyl-CoA dehydrogenase